MTETNSVRVVFKPVYELINSLAVYIDKTLTKNSELGQIWAQDTKKNLPPTFIKQLVEKSLQKDVSLLGNLLIVAHDQPVHSTEEIAAWFNEMNIQTLFEYASSSPALLEEFMPNVKNIPHTIKLLEEWNRSYFTGIDPAIIGGLEEEACQKQQLTREMDPVDLIEQVTCGIRLEDIHPQKTIFLAPQYHAHPFNFMVNYVDLFIAQYPADILQTPGEPSHQLMRLTTALADPTRLKIMQLLAQNELSFTAIVKNFEMSKSTIHYHLISLRAAGLVRVHVKGGKGKECFRYSLRRSTLDQFDAKLKVFLDQNSAADPEVNGSR